MNRTLAAPACPRNRRVLIVDDNPAIHADIRKILRPSGKERSAILSHLEAELLDQAPPPAPAERIRFDVDSAHQGQEGLALAQRAQAEGRPYAMAFVDVRMPPGWDGIETTAQLWNFAPDLQIVICTAYSDYSWDEMLKRLGSTDRLVILRKPFDTIEVLQLANALTEKWNLLAEARQYAADLERQVRVRTAALEETHTALQAEVARRAAIEADLIRAKEVAEAADHAKSAFLANMSHEIRTPMNGVIGMANLLHSTCLEPEQLDYVRTLCECCDSVLTLINDILDLSKIESGRLELERVDFLPRELAQLVLALQREPAARKNLQLAVDFDAAVPACVRGDPTRLRQVLLNLVANAVKFTVAGGVTLRVSASAASAADRQALRFEITDTGIGIPAEKQARLFQPFAQADVSTARHFGGTGLGLAISKRLVELMDGQLGVVSQPGAGSTFWFTAEFARVDESEWPGPDGSAPQRQA